MSSTRLQAALAAALLLFFPAARSLSAQEPAVPPVIRSVRVEPRDLIDTIELRTLVAVKEKEPLDSAAVEQTRQNFLATGRFSSVEARLSDENGEASVTFVLTPQPYVGRIRVKGSRQIRREELLNGMDVKVWRPVSDVALDAVPAQVIEAYTRAGLPEPEVKVDRGPSEPDGKTTIDLQMKEQPLPRLSSLRSDLSGLHWLSAASTKVKFAVFRFRSKLSGYNKKRLVQLTQKEQKRVRGLGYRGAVFEVVEEAVETGRPSTSVLVKLTLGPKEELKRKGIDRAVMNEVSNSWKRRRVPLSEGIVNRLARAATEGMKERGYLDVTVQPTTRQEPGKKTVVLEANRGTRSYVAVVKFEGNSTVAEKALKEAASVYPPRFLGLQKSRPGPLTIEDSILGLSDLYVTEGFPEAKITARLEGEGAAKTVVFTIEEGKRLVIDDVRYQGAAPVEEKEFLHLTRVRKDHPYSATPAEKDAEKIRKFYASRGFESVTVTPQAAIGEGGRVTLTFEVVPGPAYKMGTSIVSGNFKTRTSRILVMGDQKKGKPVDPQKLGKHQSRLSTLGIFDAISVKTVDVPGSDPPEKTCLIRVTERQTGYVEYGLDINTDRGIEVAGAIGERNLFGRAVSGSLSVLAGTERFNVATSLSQPTLFGMHVFNGVKASYTKDGTYTGFALETQALELGFNRDFTPKKRLSLVYRIERQTPVSIEAGYEDAAGLEQVRIGSVTPTLSLDNRDDQFMTTKGDYILATVKVSRQAFGGDTDFDRYEIQRNWYKTYGGTFTVATALRFGYARIGDGQELPIGERFFLGGANSHRGFREKELSPVAEDGSLLGGTSYALGNAELRFPLLGPLAGGIFVDAGNAFLDGIKVSDLRWAVGTGLRLGTPIGPLRVDVGFNLGKKENESSYVVHFAIGHAF